VSLVQFADAANYGVLPLNKPSTGLSGFTKKKQKMIDRIWTPVTGVAARNDVGWATPALVSCGLLHVFNMIGGLIIKYRISPARIDNRFYGLLPL